MNYNPKMGFSEQDYHLLKTHQSSGSASGVKQELLKEITQIEFDDQHNYTFDIVCDCYSEGSVSFSGSSGCTVSRIGSTAPSNVGEVSKMTITVATNGDNGTRGQIEFGGVKYKITCSSGSSWTITLPTGYFFNGVKTEVGDPGEVL